MSEYRDLLERERKQFRLPSDAFERLQHRRARQQRNRRIATAVLALALSAAATGTLFLAFRHETIAPRPAGVIDRSNVGRLRLLWTSPTGQAVGPPALALEAVVVGSERTGLYAFPASCLGKTTCAPLWTTKIQNFVPPAPFVADQKMYLTVTPDHVFVLPAACFARAASSCTPTPIGKAPYLSSGPVVSDGLVYAIGVGHLYAFSATCAKRDGCPPVWQAIIRATGPPLTPPAAAAGSVYVTTDDRQLLAFDASCGTGGATCHPTWGWKLPANVPGGLSEPVVADGVVYVERAGHVYAFQTSCATGGAPCQPLWEAQTPSNLSIPAVANGTVYFGSIDGAIYAFSASCGSGDATCKPEWTARAGSIIGLSAPAISGGLVYVPSFNGRLYAFPTQCGTGGATCKPLWTGQASGALTTPALAHGIVYVGSDDGRLYAFGLGGTTHHAWDGRLTLMLYVGLAAVGYLFLARRPRRRSLP